MVNDKELINKNLNHIWHPGVQMKDFESSPPIIVYKAKGSYLYTNQGKVFDAISSWWCKSLGHGHPVIMDAIKDQLNQFEHVIGANTTHPKLVKLGEKLAKISRKQHVFFASDGSCAVEIAMKLAIHANIIKGKPQRNQFIALENAYHGETLGALSISDLQQFKKPYEGFGVECHFIKFLPYVAGEADPVWQDSKSHWLNILPQLEKIKDNVCALIVEPIIQGANGMRCYSQDFLNQLAAWASANDIYLIADEIMTGLGRTGKWLACHHAGVEADLICLSKGLTSGTLPLSCVLIDHAVYELFYDDDRSKSFLHSHTYSGNALAVSAALATLSVMEEEDINKKAKLLGDFMLQQLTQVANITGKLSQVRSIGAMVAADVIDQENKRLAWQLSQEALSRGALLRPLGNTLYWLPPLTTSTDDIEKLAEITLNSIKAL